ncbi:hypothetical protein ACJRO7_033821 [Eucalyptus globulus]|uniref:F-box domain-containing protein n=1 Tax=Eucalyptus globulus TaxID=34317 RepID=A0ABD3J4I2_EUCGL
MSSSSDDDPKLPHDVAIHILKRLPVRSLLRFRCVCRSWRSTIDDPRFVALHLSHSALDACNWHLVCDPLQDMCSLLPNASLTLPSNYDFVGSCNGLICVTRSFIIGSDPTMYLWNLFTRKHKAIPRPAPENPILRGYAACISLGFGFDAGSNDYKIVRILFCPANCRRFGRTKCSAKIYSLKIPGEVWSVRFLHFAIMSP